VKAIILSAPYGLADDFTDGRQSSVTVMSVPISRLLNHCA
jgi:hypothetical protein